MDLDFEYSQELQIRKRQKIAKHLEYLEKLRINTIHYEELYDFIDMIINDNPFLGIENNITVLFEDLDEETLGQFNPVDNTISLSRDYIYAVANGQKSFAKLLTTIGHEFRHYVQHAMVDKMENIADEELVSFAEKMKDSFSFQDVVDEQDYILFMTLVGKYSEDSAVQSFNRMSHDDRVNAIKKIKYGEYLQRAHEEDARVVGAQFCQDVLTLYAESDICDKYIREWLLDLKKEVVASEEKRRDNEDEYISYYHNFKGVMDSAIKDVTYEEIVDINRGVNDLIKMGHDTSFDDKNRRKDFDYLFNKTSAFLELCLNSVLKEKSADELAVYFGYYFSKQERELSKKVVHSVQTNTSLSAEEKNEFIQKVFQYFTDNLLAVKFDLNDTYLRDVFSKEQINQLVDQLVQANKIEDACELLHVSSVYVYTSSLPSRERAFVCKHYQIVSDQYKSIKKQFETGDVLEEDAFKVTLLHKLIFNVKNYQEGYEMRVRWKESGKEVELPDALPFSSEEIEEMIKNMHEMERVNEERRKNKMTPEEYDAYVEETFLKMVAEHNKLKNKYCNTETTDQIDTDEDEISD